MNTTALIVEARKLLDAARSEHKTVGFVPTMGALHKGHVSLIERARGECGFVVVSIFVNPTQFAPGEDLSKYPRTFADDLERCLAAGVDLVFHPDADEMYGPEGSATTVSVRGLSDPMEGEFRPGHFDGVATVVAKLFNIVGGCRAYFGQKDAQQLRVVTQMAADLNMPVEVVGCPTVRDADGLALSSRNHYLTQADRGRAISLVRALRSVEAGVANGERDPSVLLLRARQLLDADAVDYVEIVDPRTLQRVERIEGDVLVCGAIRLGATRLIDNIVVQTGGKG